VSDDGCAEGYETCDCCDGTGAALDGDDGLYYDCKICVGGGTVCADCKHWPCNCPLREATP
jgi:hypothetical protein